MSDERMPKDNFHLRTMALAIDVLNRNRNRLKPRELDLLEALNGMQEIRSMPTLKQWNWMNSLKQDVMA